MSGLIHSMIMLVCLKLQLKTPPEWNFILSHLSPTMAGKG